MLLNKHTTVIFVLLLFSSFTYAQLAGTPGAFARMGFGARGMAMGNAMTAVKNGELSGFYNPAAIAFAQEGVGSLSYGILSLERSHNSLFYTLPLDTTAAVSLGILNSGVSDIDGRDYDGFSTEMYSTSENMFSFSFGLRIRKISIGVSTKIYYYSLFKDVSWTSLGFDMGAVYPLTPTITVAAALKDFNAKYKWNTSRLYGEYGNTTIDKFPFRRSFGISYTLENNTGMLTSEIETSNKSTTTLRFGAEYSFIEELTIQAGIDGWELNNAKQAHPSFGFTLRSHYAGWNPALNYAFVVEPYGLFSIHVISLSATL